MKLFRITRTKSRCKECPLSGYCNKVWGESVSDRPKIAFIGEAPGKDEDIQGHPFVGSAGQELDRILAKAGIHRHNAYLLNLINCRPPENNLDSDEGVEALAACRPGLEEELSKLYYLGVRTLVPLGAKPTAALGIEGSIHKVRGSVYETNIAGHSFWSVPTFHPSFIIRGEWAEEPTCINDINKAVDIATNGYTPPKEDFLLFPTVRDIELRTKDILKRLPLLGVDTETTSLTYYDAEIFVMSLALSGEESFSIPFYSQGYVPYWKNGDLVRVKNCLAEILLRCPTMYQNAPFDVSVLEAQGFKVGNIAHDVLLIHHCLAGDTEVDTLDFGRRPIQELVGKDFWVVSHDGDRLIPKRAKVCWSDGKRDDLVRVVFWCKDRIDKRKMWIDCTADHEFPIQGKDHRVKAIELVPGDRLYRGQLDRNRIAGKRIHRWVFETLFGPLGNNDVHHIDGNHFNNNPENLMKVSKSEHQDYHRDNRYRATMRMVQVRKEERSAKADPDQIEKLYCAGLSGREVAKELGCTHELVRRILKERSIVRSRSEALRLRWEKSSNCRVISVVPLKGSQEVFDLEVEDTHCFSANGVIVGNSIHPELPHNLGYIVSIYGATPFWKDIKLKFPLMRQTPDVDLRTYNCRDSAVLHQILKPLLQDLKETGTEHIYYDYSLKLIRPTLELTYNGMKLDRGRLRKFKKGLEEDLVKKESELRVLGNLPEDFNLQSPHHLSYWLYGEMPRSYAAWEDELESYNDPEQKKRTNTKKYADLKAKVEFYDKVTPLIRSKSAVKRNKTGYSKDEKTLLLSRLAATTEIELISKFRRPTAEHKERLASLEKLRSVLVLFQKRQEIAKMLSTYTDYATARDNRVHPRFSIYGTATGRLSSDSPNWQNLPTDAKNLFVPEPGHAFVAGDFSNLELRVQSFEWNDPVLQKMFKEGKNIHDENTKVMFGINKSNPNWKHIRRAAKIAVFGRGYGGGIRGIYERVAAEVPELSFTMAQFKAADQKYFEAHPKIREGMDKAAQTARDTRVCVTATGRKRFFLGMPEEIEREGINTPIQGTAGDIENETLIDLYAECMKRKDWKLVATVHDSNVIECPIADIDECTKVIKSIMEKPRHLWKKIIVFPADIEVSLKSWGEMEGYDEWKAKQTKKQSKA
jgi:uracil-DNA glycosylase family 4